MTLEKAIKEAYKMAKEEGATQHINRINNKNFKVSDWYDYEDTVASITEKGTLKINDMFDDDDMIENVRKIYNTSKTNKFENILRKVIRNEIKKILNEEKTNFLAKLLNGEVEDNYTHEGDLDLSDSDIEELPYGLRVNGNLDISYTKIKRLPQDLYVTGNLKAEGLYNIPPAGVISIPHSATIKGKLYLDVDYYEDYTRIYPDLSYKINFWQ